MHKGIIKIRPMRKNQSIQIYEIRDRNNRMIWFGDHGFLSRFLGTREWGENDIVTFNDEYQNVQLLQRQ